MDLDLLFWISFFLNAIWFQCVPHQVEVCCKSFSEGWVSPSLDGSCTLIRRTGMSFFFQVLVHVSINVGDTHYVSNTFSYNWSGVFDVAHQSKVVLQRFWRGECHQKQLDGTTCIFLLFWVEQDLNQVSSHVVKCLQMITTVSFTQPLWLCI